MSNDLLPSSATPQEKAMAETIARVSDVPVLVRESWNPNTCPAELLPWLAWAFSVDEWDTTWTEQEKRDVINNSLLIHKHKGTIGAIDRALRPLGYLIEVVEWWEQSPPGDPYTFSIVMGTGSKPVTEELYEKAERIVLTYKNLRSQLVNLTVKADVRGAVYVGCALVDGNDTTVFPYSISEIESEGAFYFASCTQDVTETSIYPEGWMPDELIARTVDGGEFRVTTAGYMRITQGA